MFRGDSVDDVSSESTIAPVEEPRSLSVVTATGLTLLACVLWGLLAAQQLAVWLSATREEFGARGGIATLAAVLLLVSGIAIWARASFGCRLGLVLHASGVVVSVGLAYSGAHLFAAVAPVHLVALITTFVARRTPCRV